MPRTAITRRHLLRYAAMGAAAATLAACTPSGGQKAEPTKAPAAEQPKPATSKITLQQWYHEYGEKGCQEAVYRIADEYNKSQDKVKVEVTWTPGDYTAKLNSALAAGTGPDVYESSLNIDRVRNKHVVPLDDLYEGVKDDFDEKDLKLSTLEGKIWGVRMIIDTGLLYCRKSILDAAGVKVPTTFDEMVEAAKKLTTGRQKGLFLGNDGGGIMQDQAARAAGVIFLDDNNELKFNTPVLAAAWEKARDLSKSGYLLTGSPTDWWDPAAFTQGLCAMCWGGLWMMPGVRQVIQEDFYVTQFPPVHVPGGSPTYSTFWGGWIEFVNGQSKYIPEAKAFVKWLWIENTKWQNEWASAYGFHVPPRKSAAAANEKFKEGNAKIAKDGLYKYGWANPPMWNGTMGTAVSDAFWNVVKQGKDAKAEIQAAYDKCKAELDKQLKG